MDLKIKMWLAYATAYFSGSHRSFDYSCESTYRSLCFKCDSMIIYIAVLCNRYIYSSCF